MKKKIVKLLKIYLKFYLINSFLFAFNFNSSVLNACIIFKEGTWVHLVRYPSKKFQDTAPRIFRGPQRDIIQPRPSRVFTRSGCNQNGSLQE